MTPAAATWIFIGVCGIVALGLMAYGAIAVLRGVRTLQRRIDGYRHLPLIRAIDETQTRLIATQARMAEVQPLLERATTAVEAIRAGFASLRDTATLVVAVPGQARTLVTEGRALFRSSRSKVVQIPES